MKYLHTEMNRAENLHRLETEEFDLRIIGGGVSGAGCALDAALRGLKVALIERNDFAAETSSRSTKMVNGGVRYLEQAFKKLDFAQLRQVRHGLQERRIVLQNAPHLAHPLGLTTPVFSWLEGLYFSIGLKLYDWFPGFGSNKLAKKDNKGKLSAAIVADPTHQSAMFEIKATRFINCTGPFADSIRQMANPALAPRIQPSKGVHLVLPANIIQRDMAMLIPKTRDGRMIFAIPF